MFFDKKLEQMILNINAMNGAIMFVIRVIRSIDLWEVSFDVGSTSRMQRQKWKNQILWKDMTWMLPI